jgi:hypothetical protein
VAKARDAVLAALLTKRRVAVEVANILSASIVFVCVCWFVVGSS